ncbi:hypothetical protein GCM10009809_27250 [Isoptericola hypogeus]|uniref:Uncharacterized protein n=1 Tax=Isoptericola hypogeus TaxID=300179 RepID=A0ABP4VPD2_9MICO
MRTTVPGVAAAPRRPRVAGRHDLRRTEPGDDGVAAVRDLLGPSTGSAGPGDLADAALGCVGTIGQ